MVKNLLRKCLLVTCIFITLCPKRGRFASEEEITKRNNNINKNYNNNNNFNFYNRKNKKNINHNVQDGKDKTNDNNNVRTNDNDNDNDNNNDSNNDNNNDNNKENNDNNNTNNNNDNDENNDNDNLDDITKNDNNDDNINNNNDIAEKEETENDTGNLMDQKQIKTDNEQSIDNNNSTQAGDDTAEQPINVGDNFDVNNSNTTLKLSQKDRNKLKDIMKEAAITLWTGLQNAEPGFDLDTNEMAQFKIWPGGDVPYYIDEYSFDTTLQTRIRDTVVNVNSVTGLRFNELRSPPIDQKTRFVFFINRRGVLPCVDYTSKNFTNEGVQKVVLGYDCLSTHKSLGSLILALAGVPPQHNSPTRDQHILLQMDNILPDKVHLFEKIPDNEWLFHDVDYDYNSAGHYDLFQYTTNGKATIKLSINDVTSLGSDGLSYGDLWKIRMLYNYISRHRATIGKSECSKLFVPGSKFKKYRPDSDEDVTPRKKPSKYLGITEDQTADKDDIEKQPEEADPAELAGQIDQDADNNTGNEKQSGSDKQSNKFNDNHEDNYGDITDNNENTIFRTHKRP